MSQYETTRTAVYTGTYDRLGISIYASDRTVIRHARRKLKKHAHYTRAQREARHAFYRDLLNIHHAARDLARHFAM